MLPSGKGGEIQRLVAEGNNIRQRERLDAAADSWGQNPKPLP